MNRFLPHLVWIAGLLVVLVGLALGPGVPYQDPTPEMSGHFNHEEHIAIVIMLMGCGIFLFGLVVAMVFWLCHWKPRKNPASITT